MKSFWKGFNSPDSSSPVRFKKHVIILYWSSDNDKSKKLKENFGKLALKYPTVVVKTVNIKKDPLKPLRHKVLEAPTILLLKDGREVDRLTADDGSALLEYMFRKAHS